MALEGKEGKSLGALLLFNLNKFRESRRFLGEKNCRRSVARRKTPYRPLRDEGGSVVNGVVRRKRGGWGTIRAKCIHPQSDGRAGRKLSR